MDGVVESVAIGHPVQAVDTTGAGDSFNAGYLAARFHDRSRVEAARFANQVAGTVIRYPGAIISAADTPKLPKVFDGHVPAPSR
ncbi:hypothetical protein ENE74_04235 [Sphingobium algorifonticola]|uniref:Carbohydrate kinase PfkB domain-containing protein n=1 Tax=Sphingobium algorifonticola TaxID=2008318 RepID=A0A437JD45_9SPHN|nr:hypothetical protein ENE74_04235 [Sphingobium algorifonticola]